MQAFFTIPVFSSPDAERATIFCILSHVVARDAQRTEQQRRREQNKTFLRKKRKEEGRGKREEEGRAHPSLSPNECKLEEAVARVEDVVRSHP